MLAGNHLAEFHVEIDDPKIQTFCEVYNLKSLIRLLTYYEKPDKPSGIDLIMTNVSRMFQSTYVIETGLSDFSLTTMTVMRKIFKKV